MPIEYKSYGCKHKCGYRHNTNKRRIERHESECWKAIENQTCETCDHNSSYTDWCDHPELPGYPIEKWFIRQCDHPHGSDILDRNYDSLKMDDHKNWVKPVVHCPFHSSIGDDEKQLQQNFWNSND